jgi:uncharacterized DUF497 family protein
MTAEFEWDDNKNIENFFKHGVTFEDAILVFLDPQLAEFYDSRHSDIFEDRWKVYGFVNRVLAVSFSERNGKIRIISARRATPAEEEEYFYGYSQSLNESIG